jgi:hypothetical protein
MTPYLGVEGVNGGGAAERRLDIFPYRNVMLGHGEGGDYIGCV